MKIQKTEKYSLFKRIAGNRTVNKAQVTKLFNSIGHSPEIVAAIPIIVNNKMQIIDGQHRFEALKKLEMPVYYVKIKGLELRDVQRMNSNTKVWRPIDYAKSFCELGNENYNIYLKFRKRYKLSHNILVSYLSDINEMRGGKNTVQAFRSGEFKVVDEKISADLCEKFNEVRNYYKRGDSRPFALAFKIAYASPDYDHKRMMDKIDKYSNFFQDSPFPEDYMRQFERIYNHHCGVNRVKLY